MTFGTADNLAGATLAGFDLPTAQALFNTRGHYDTINVLAKPGADNVRLQRAIAEVLPPGVEVVTGQTVANELSSAVSNALSFLSTALLVFALISLFVGAFTIFNTFSITVGQRTRELALLRIVGASRRQVFRSVLGEAALVGFAASLIGLGLGVLAALGLEALLGAFGITLPSAPLVFEARTVVVALVVGVGVTVVSAISPARRAVRIPPVAALVATREEQPESLRRRVAIGGARGGRWHRRPGRGLDRAGDPARRAGRGGRLHRHRHAGADRGPADVERARPPLAACSASPGRLGRENSMRSPRRTAQTASALMVGMALVSAIAVFGASLSESAKSSLDSAINADYIITGPSSGFSTSVAPRVARIPGVGDGHERLQRPVRAPRLAVEPRRRARRPSCGRQSTWRSSRERRSRARRTAELLIDTTTATAKHLSVGSMVPVKLRPDRRLDDADRRDLQPTR